MGGGTRPGAGSLGSSAKGGFRLIAVGRSEKSNSRYRPYNSHSYAPRPSRCIAMYASGLDAKLRIRLAPSFLERHSFDVNSSASKTEEDHADDRNFQIFVGRHSDLGVLHFGKVLRDSPMMRAISHSDLLFRPRSRRILPIMSMVITPPPLHKKNSRVGFSPGSVLARRQQRYFQQG